MYISKIGDLVPNSIIKLNGKPYVVLGDRKDPHICVQVNDIKFVYNDDLVDVLTYEEVEKEWHGMTRV